MLRIALPSNADWQDPTLDFLDSCGLAVQRVTSRRYTGRMPAVPDAVVLFQRAADIPRQVEAGAAEIGIAGLDQYLEAHPDDGAGMLLVESLGFRGADLVIAVPESWEDISNADDLVELSGKYVTQGKPLRVATKYPRLTGKYLQERGVSTFSIIEAGGTLEAAPAMGYADFIVDITSSGNTLRENQLKTISGGTVVKSQACLFANRDLLSNDEEALAGVRIMLELIEGHLRASEYYSIIANIRGDSPEQIAGHIQDHPEIAGIEGPTVSQVFSKEGQTGWYAVTMVVGRDKVITALDHLRAIGGNGIILFPTTYVFEAKCSAYDNLLEQLGRASVETSV